MEGGKGYRLRVYGGERMKYLRGGGRMRRKDEISFGEESKSPKKSKNCPKIVRNKSRKMIQGSPDHGMDENCAPNPLEGLPDLKTPFKNSKKTKIKKKY